MKGQGWLIGFGFATLVLLITAPVMAQGTALERRVDCGEGMTVANVLDRAPPVRPLVITVVGVCEEAIEIDRDDVTIQGENPGDGFQAPTQDSRIIYLNAAHRVTLNQLTLTGGRIGIVAFAANFYATDISINSTNGFGVLLAANSSSNFDNLYIDDAHDGISSRNGAIARVIGGVISNSQRNGVEASRGGQIYLLPGAVIRDSGVHGVQVSNNGSVRIEGAVVTKSGAAGVFAYVGGSVTIYGRESIISENQGAGIEVKSGHAELDESQVFGNLGDGVFVFNGGAVTIQNQAVIKNNAGSGVVVMGGSSAAFHREARIEENAVDGIKLRDTSVAIFEAPGAGTNVITNNGGFGIICDPYPSVAQITGGVGTVINNALGQISCPQN